MFPFRILVISIKIQAQFLFQVNYTDVITKREIRYFWQKAEIIKYIFHRNILFLRSSSSKETHQNYMHLLKQNRRFLEMLRETGTVGKSRRNPNGRSQPTGTLSTTKFVRQHNNKSAGDQHIVCCKKHNAKKSQRRYACFLASKLYINVFRKTIFH